MSSGQPSDEEITRNYYRAIFLVLGSLVLTVAGEAGLLFAARTQIAPSWLINGMEVLLAVAWVLYALVYFAKPGNLPPHDQGYLRRTIDIQQRRARGTFLVLIPSAFSTGGAMTSLLVLRPVEGPLLFLISLCNALCVVIVLLALSGVLFPYTLNDELRRTQRAKAMQFGFVLAVIEMCAVVIADAWRPHWGPAALPLATTIAVTLPSFYFLFLEWRADRG